MNEREYLRLRREIEDEAKRKLDALELVWSMICERDAAGTDSTRSRSTGPLQRQPQPPKAGTLRHAVYELIRDHFQPGDAFDINLIGEILGTRFPEHANPNPTSVSGALGKLAEDGFVVVSRVGAGKRPTIYMKPMPKREEAAESVEDELRH